MYTINREIKKTLRIIKIINSAVILKAKTDPLNANIISTLNNTTNMLIKIKKNIQNLDYKPPAINQRDYDILRKYINNHCHKYTKQPPC